MPVEKLDVAVEVLVEIAAAEEGPADRANGIHPERQAEEDNRTETSAREPLEPDECNREPVSGVTQAQAGFWRR